MICLLVLFLIEKKTDYFSELFKLILMNNIFIGIIVCPLSRFWEKGDEFLC